MALYKRDGIWWTDIYHQGKRIRKSTETEIRQDAQRFHDQLKLDLWNEKTRKSLPKKSWMDAVVCWIEESQHKRSLEMDKMHLTWLDPYLRKKMLVDVDRDLIESIAQKKEQTGVSASTVNRMLEIIRAILNRAHKQWGWLELAPVIRMRKEDNRRIRWLTKVQAERLLKELPLHLRDMAAFTLCTGLRESNVTQLKWSVVDLDKGMLLFIRMDLKLKELFLYL